MRLLVVDDGPLMRDELLAQIKWFKRKQDFEITYFESAADAKAQLREAGQNATPYDLFLLDLELPEEHTGRPLAKHGLEVLRVAKDEKAAKATVVISESTEAINPARRLGVRDFISKTDLRVSDIQNAIECTLESLPRKALAFHSSFISYSSTDQEFATQLHADLQKKGVRCWFAPADLKIGDKLRLVLDEAIRSHDKLIVLLSKNAVNSVWVEKEVETAFEKERQQNRIVLFPLRLDDAVMETRQAWAADIRRTRHIGDFRAWKNHDSYKKALDRLLRDLKAEDNAEFEP